MRDRFNESTRAVEAMRVAGWMNRLANLYENNGEQGYNGFKQRLQPFIKDFHKNYEKDIDAQVFAELMASYAKESPTAYVPAALAKIKARPDGDFQEYANELFSQSFHYTSFPI